MVVVALIVAVSFFYVSQKDEPADMEDLKTAVKTESADTISEAEDTGVPPPEAAGGTPTEQETEKSPEASEAGGTAAPPGPYVRSAGPRTFSYTELAQLFESDISSALDAKLETLLTTPFLSNEAYYRGARPHQPVVGRIGKSLRLVAWNIERGLELDDIKLMFTSPSGFQQRVQRSGQQVDKRILEEELAVLRSADVIVLNEADWGLKRTNYRHVTRELAEALDMNWAYGVEFVEVDPITLGTEKFLWVEDEDERREWVEQVQTDRTRLLALHGTAVLSRYPILEAELVPFEFQGYDWFQGEKQRLSELEKGKRKLAEVLFQETMNREIRRGGRTTLFVTIETPDLPEGRVTVAAAHLESRTKPESRRSQMTELLDKLKDVKHPVLLAGDLNTTLSDQRPTNAKREVYRRIGSKAFWANTGIKYATGVGALYDAVRGGINFFKNQQDPTAKHVPFVAPNPEAKLFNNMEDFRFADGFRFDFRGDDGRTVNGTSGTLANSNQRDKKGFASTFEVDRTLGPIGKYKLDWIFVKSYLKKPRDESGSYRFAPHFARSMEEVNYALEEPLSDHTPISVDLPFTEPSGL